MNGRADFSDPNEAVQLLELGGRSAHALLRPAAQDDREWNLPQAESRIVHVHAQNR